MCTIWYVNLNVWQTLEQDRVPDLQLVEMLEPFPSQPEKSSWL